MNGKSLFMSNFKFRKSRHDESSAYRTAGSLNSHDSLDATNNYHSAMNSTMNTTLDMTLNSTLNLDDHLTSLNNNNDDGKEDLPPNFVLPAKQVVINKKLGKGEFGIVQQGVWTDERGEHVQVAIKCLSEERMNYNSAEFLKEAKIMYRIAHPNIVRLFGVVLDDGSSPLMLVTELAPLKSLLECLRDQSLKLSFTVSSLCDFACQICNGMQYLEKNRLIHRDLAARNILVFTKNLVKISDFGLSRALGVGKDYYRIDDSQINNSLKLPIAWCAPECINFFKFTSSSDIWSYAVTLWEMFSYGDEPWNKLSGRQILEAIDEPNYRRLEQPDYCPRDYYSIMVRCWDHDPSKRPKFSEIINMLPDCKPELVQAVKDSLSNGLNNDLSSQSDHQHRLNHNQQTNLLQFHVGDIITVLDKNPLQSGEQQANQTLWKGCLNGGEVGLFNPNATVSYLGQNLPNCNNGTSSTNAQSHSSSSGSSSHSSGHTKLSVIFKSLLDKSHHHHNDKTANHKEQNSKKKIKPEMISKPKGDLKHTGHVGADGAFFGDISYLGDRYKASDSDKISLSRNSSDMSDKTPLLNSNHLSSKETGKKDSLKRNINKLTLNTNGCSALTDHEYHEISEDEGGLCSPKFKPFDFGPPLMDEVFKELNMNTDFDKEFNLKNLNVNNDKSADKPDKNEKASGTAAATLLPTKKKQASSLKLISAEEEQSLDSAIAMVKELATKSMFSHFDSKEKNDSLTLLDNCSITADSPRFAVTSPTKKNIFSFKFNKSSKEQKTFSDQLNNKQSDHIADSLLSQEAKEAYESLVESGTIKKMNKSESKESNKAGKINYPFIGDVKAVSSGKAKASSIFSKSSISRTQLPKPPPVPCKQPGAQATGQIASQQTNSANNGNSIQINHQQLVQQQQQHSLLMHPPNPLPLPPRSDRTRSLIQLKHHERRHPLIIPDLMMDGSDILSSLQANNKLYYDHEPKQLMSTFKPHMPALHRNLSLSETTKPNTLLEYTASLAPQHCMPGLSNLAKEPRCPQIPADVFVGLPVVRDEDCRTPADQKQKDIIEFNFDNRNFKINLSKLREESPDEIRLMMKVLAHQVQVSSEDCLETLKTVNFEVHKAIKIIQLRETLKQQSIAVENCNWIEILTKTNWQIRAAINHCIAQQSADDGTTTAV